MNDPVWRVGVQPVNALSARRLADVRRNVDSFTVVKDQKVLVYVYSLAFLRIARNATDRLAVWHHELRQQGF